MITFEICSSALIVAFPKRKCLVTARPSTLIENGKLCLRAMRESRLTLDELITELRQNGYSDIDEVLYAILEKNGKITIIPKVKYAQPTCQQLDVKTTESGIFHIIIDNGTINAHGLSTVGLSREQLLRKLKKYNTVPKDVYLMMINDSGEERLITKKEAL